MTVSGIDVFSPQFERSIVVSSDSDLWLLSSLLSRLTATSITVNNNCGNSVLLFSLDFTPFSLLRQITIGDNCFGNVREVKLSGLNELESVEIGMNSFTKYKNRNDITADPNHHVYLKNCPKLKSLKMGRYSFSDYSMCEIEKVDALEVIEIGDLNEWSNNFRYASLELKSILIHKE